MLVWSAKHFLPSAMSAISMMSMMSTQNTMFDRVFRDELLLVVVVVLLHHGRVVPAAVHPHVFFMVKIWTGRFLLFSSLASSLESLSLIRLPLSPTKFPSKSPGREHSLPSAISTLFLLLLCFGLVGDDGALLTVRDVRDVRNVLDVDVVAKRQKIVCFKAFPSFSNAESLSLHRYLLR